jgi:hypothetical protein
MKTRLTLYIDENVVIKAKEYAKRNGISLSFLVENCLRSLLKMPLLKIKKRKK